MILLDDKLGIVEAKFLSSESHLESSFIDAIYDVCRRIKKNSEYKLGVAFTVNFDLATGKFEYVYRIVTTENVDTAFDGLHLTNAQIGRNKQLGINVSKSASRSRTNFEDRSKSIKDTNPQYYARSRKGQFEGED